MSDQTPLAALNTATRPGWKTSEFWLAAIAIVGNVVNFDGIVGRVGEQLSQRGTIGAIVAGAVAGAYAVGRSIVKGMTAKALLTDVPSPIEHVPDGGLKESSPAR